MRAALRAGLRQANALFQVLAAIAWGAEFALAWYGVHEWGEAAIGLIARVIGTWLTVVVLAALWNLLTRIRLAPSSPSSAVENPSTEQKS
jgi:hypothetical protein